MYFKRKDMELTTFELIDQLIEKPKEEILYALFRLMVKEKLSWDDLNRAYVKYLEATKKDMTNQLFEAETCVIESFHNKKVKDDKKNKSYYNHTQRCLYLLNQSKRFNMGKLNENYEYDESFAKTMSWYEREKERINL